VATYDALFDGAPATFDVILTNPPFGGKEGRDAQKNFAFETSATQVLFRAGHPGRTGAAGGRPGCRIVLDEGLLFRTNESAFVETKRKLLDECDLWAIVSLPGGVFSTAGAGVKTNLLFFTAGKKTERIWYYDLSHVKVGKKTPLTHFGFGKDGAVLESTLPAPLVADWNSDEANADQPFPSYARVLASRSDSRYSWTVDFAARRAKARGEMQPLLDQAASARAAAVDLKEDLKRLKKDKAAAAKIGEMESAIREHEKAARDLEAEAATIDAAVFDLKAVNPNVVTVVDERTPAQLIASANEHGKLVTQALNRLTALLAQS
jgi:type I restriction enzyme M protein